ncbi:MAG: retropepsin-like domain-containing protein [Candidatus Levybacteria bacterium]|nr:retropepsin-like domain-containing protein [Candidatus Levybacteria bacterium]
MKHLVQPSIKIPYRTYPNSGNILWPIVELQLATEHSSLTQPILALVDSGASISVLHPIIAEVLGFNPRKTEASQQGISASGMYKSWLFPHVIEVNLYGYTFFRRFTIIDNSSFLWPCILGEDSIFEVAGIDFRKFKGFFEVRFRQDIN